MAPVQCNAQGMVEGMEADPSTVLDLIEAFRRSKTMFCAVSLGVFDLLMEGAATSSAVSEKLGTHQDAMERLLEACTGLKLLQKQGNEYANTATAQEYLCRNSSRSMTGYILYSNNVLFPIWGHLEDAIREGTHRWQQTFGSTGPLFSSFFPTEEKMRTFIMGMHGFGVLSSPAVVAAVDLSRFRQMVDLGGATGHLTVAACERYPSLQGTIFDFPDVLKVAREQIHLSSACDRIQCIPGDFFTDPLPPGDLYALGRILHDWSPAKIDFLLKKIYEQLPTDGALLIAEKLLDEDKLGPVAAQMQSLNMLVVTEGKERNLPEYTVLLKEAGFCEIQGVKTGKPIDLILARKR